MKNIFLLSLVAMLGLTTATAQNKTKAVKRNPAKAAPVSAPTGKIVYVDFNIDTSHTPNMINRRLLMTELLAAIQNKKIVAYDTWIRYDATGNNVFSKPLNYLTLMKHLKDTLVVDAYDKSGELIRKKKVIDFRLDRLTGYRLKQEIVVDQLTGLQKINIIGIAPVRPMMLSNGDLIEGDSPVCWVRYESFKSALTGAKFDNTVWNGLFVGGKVRGEGI